MVAATTLFADRGYHPTAVSDIVDSLGVGKGVFYWYFSSKEELLSEILRDAHLQLRRAQQAAIADEPDPVRRIELGIFASLEWFQVHREYFAITQFAATDETFAPVLRRNREVAVADTVRHIKEAMVEGRIADGEPELLASAYRSAFALASEHSCSTVAAPSISTGIYGFPIELAAQIAIGEAAQALADPHTSLREITFALFSDADLEVFARVL